MSRYIPEEVNPNPEPIFKAIEYWRKRCLLDDRSVFTDKNLWTEENFTEHLQTHFIKNPDERKRNFFVKLKDQLGPAPVEVRQLAAEIFWMMMLMPHKSRVGLAKKIENIETIWSWSGKEFSEAAMNKRELTECLEHGLASMGGGIMNFYWQGLYYCTVWLQDWKAKDLEERERLMEDPWEFGEYLQKWENNNHAKALKDKVNLNTSLMRHALLYLLFPEKYERILSNNHKQKIIEAFGEKDERDETNITDDRLLLKIRKRIEEGRKKDGRSKDFDFYDDEYEPKWRKKKLEKKPNKKPENVDEVTLPPLSNDEMSLNRILYGPPGTGKTYKTRELAVEITDDPKKPTKKEKTKERYEELEKEGRIDFITFHQSYGYEEFVEGIKPEVEDEKITYAVRPGIFKEICKRANKDQDNRYVLIIDEINRGNVSKILGELITLLEEDKRLGNKEELRVKLPYSKDEEPFGVPKNLYIIGTMNTADRSIAFLDTALRRRFEFIEMMPDYKVIEDSQAAEIKGVDIAKLLEEINKRITKNLDRDHQIGHSFFLKLTEKQGLKGLRKVFEKKIIPLLREYFFEQGDQIKEILGDKFFENDKLLEGDTLTKALEKAGTYQKIYEVKQDTGES